MQAKITKYVATTQRTEEENSFQETEIGSVPEDWKVAKFEQAISKRKFKVGKIKQREYDKVGKYPVIDQSQNFIAGFTNDSEKVYQGSLPVVIFGDHTRVFKFIDFPFVMGADGVKVILPNKEMVDPLYFYYALSSLKIKSRGYNRHYPLLREETIPLPPLPEQQRIAKVLGTIQRAIEQQDKIIEAAKNLKKSLMQKLFTEGIGHTEFKDSDIGQIPKSWEVVRLKEVGTDFIGGGTPSTANKEYWGGEIPWMTSAFITDLYIREGQRYITKRGLENSATALIPRNNILIGTRVGTGKVAINQVDIAISQDLTGVIINKQKAVPEYLAYALLSPRVQEQIQSKNRGVTIKGITREDLKSVVVPLAPLPEQSEIARSLSTLDDKIRTEEKRKTIFQELFKTMLHKLMTGEIRLKDVEV